MPPALKELVEKRVNLVEQAREIVTRAKDEKRAMNAECAPSPRWAISQLMQKTQRRLQLLKNTVPDPPSPTSDLSSPKCG